MQIAETERLILRHFRLEDAPFLIHLLNSPGWLRWIGDRGVRDLETAERYIETRMLESYRKWGLGSYLMELKGSGIPVGSCGLIRRKELDDVDIGFALLPEYEGQGYAGEASAEVMRMAREELGLERVVAITLPENERSVRLLERLGLKAEGIFKMGSEDLLLMSVEFERQAGAGN